MILFIAVSSKNKNSIRIFTTLIQKMLISDRLYFNDYIVRQIKNKKKLKNYSILKSPHVFKKAQRQIGFKNTTILWEFRVNTRFINQITTIIKKILQINLKDLNVHLKFTLNAIGNKNRSIKTFDPDLYSLSSYSFKNNYIHLLDIYGSSLLQTHKLLHNYTLSV